MTVSMALAWISGPGIELSVEVEWMSWRFDAVAPITTILFRNWLAGSGVPPFLPLCVPQYTCENDHDGYVLLGPR
jgi:hypothetical protein